LATTPPNAAQWPTAAEAKAATARTTKLVRVRKQKRVKRSVPADS
jgi:hypothetical protein